MMVLMLWVTVVDTPGFLLLTNVGFRGVVLIGVKIGLMVAPEGFLVTGFSVIFVVNSVPSGPRTITVGAGGFVVGRLPVKVLLEEPE